MSLMTTAGGSLEVCQDFTVGYFLSAKKGQSFLKPELIDACAKRHVRFCAIDRGRRLAEQGGPGGFQAVLHKDVSPEWVAELREYSALHPHSIIMDPPDDIVRLHSRASMLDCLDPSLLACLARACPSASLCVPPQVVVSHPDDLSRATLDRNAMAFPLVAKPLVADGSAASHRMFLVTNEAGLLQLSPPLVIQQFINHSGVIFKVYVVGSHVTCVHRKSLPDWDCTKEAGPLVGIQAFSQISNLNAPDYTDSPPLDSSMPLPDPAFVNKLASCLRERLHLSLFNFDLIQDSHTKSFSVVDINYFPGFAKMPNYAAVLAEYFESRFTQHS